MKRQKIVIVAIALLTAALSMHSALAASATTAVLQNIEESAGVVTAVSFDGLSTNGHSHASISSYPSGPELGVMQCGRAKLSYTGVPTSCDVTLHIPQLPDVSIAIRMTNLGNEYPSATVLSVTGVDSATISGGTIYSGGEYWGEIAQMLYSSPSDSDDIVVPVYPGRKINFFLRSLNSLSSWCTWSGFSQTGGSATSEYLASEGFVTNKLLEVNQMVGSGTWYGTSPTAQATSAKVVTTTSGDFNKVAGSRISVRFANATTSCQTLNIDGTGATTVYARTAAPTSYLWNAGEVVSFVYTGSYYEMERGGTATTTYYGATRLSSSTNDTSTVTAATPSAVRLVRQSIPTKVSQLSNDSGYATQSYVAGLGYVTSSVTNGLVSATAVESIVRSTLATVIQEGGITVDGHTYTLVEVSQ